MNPTVTIGIRLWVVGICLATGIFVLDLVLPLGVAVGVLYVALVLISLVSPKQQATYLATTAATILVLLGYFLSSRGEFAGTTLTNRFLALFAIWTTALVVHWRKSTEVKLRISHDEAPEQVEKRATEFDQNKQEPIKAIADRRQTESVVSMREAKLIAIFRSALDGIICINDKGIVELINPSALTMFGYTEKEILGRNIRILMPEPYHSEHDQYLENYRRTGIAKIICIGREVVGRRKDGTVFSMELSVNEFQLGEKKLFVGITRDITGPKRINEELRLVRRCMENTSDAVVITDSDLDEPGPKIEYINSAFTRMTGYLPEEVIGKTPRILQGPKTDRAVLKKLRQRLEAGMTFQGETVNYRKDGSEFILQWRIDPVRNAAGKINHWIAFQRDITGARQAEELARMQKMQLAHSSRLSMLGEITAGVTHDLLQPVYAVGNFANACRLHLEQSEEIEKSKLLALVQSITDSIDHAKGVISRLLEFARRGEPQRLPMTLRKPIDDVLQLLEYELQKNRITVKTELQPGISVLADEVQFQQVLVNLLHNACEAFQEAGTDDAQIVIQAETREDGMCGFRIEDNGPGIPPESVKRIFSSFYTTRPHGLGLGLAISKTIVEAHGGTIWLTLNPDRGVTFHFTMPLATVAERSNDL